MPTVNIPIPPNFNRDMRRFMADVQKMQELTQKFIVTSQRMPSIQSLYLSHQSITSQLARLHQVINKWSATLQRTIDTVINSLGTVAKTFLRGLSIAAETFIPIIGTIAVVGTEAVSFGAMISKWLWNKMVGLGDSILQDYLSASGSYSSIGGLRAYRTAFGLVNDPGLLPGMVQARGSVSSRQYAALKLLGVRAQRDTADMMMQATIAAAEFMKHQDKGRELMMAEALGLTSLFNPKTLIMLKGMTEKELRETKQMYEHYKSRMNLSLKAVVGWKNFSLQVKATGAQIKSIIAERLADPNSPFIQALTRLSESFVRFFRIFAENILTKERVDKLGRYIDEFAKWLEDPKVRSGIEKFIKNLGDIIKDIAKAIEMLKDMIRDLHHPEVLHGRRVLARKLGIDHPYPVEDQLARYPGRAKFLRKIGALPETPVTRAPERQITRPSSVTGGAVNIRGLPGTPSGPAVSRDFSKDNTGKQLDPVVFAQAEQLAKNGDVQGVYKFINSHGGHVDTNYCGDFVGAVTRAEGGTPPKGYPVATSWANYGTPVKPGDEQPGDIAIYMRGHKPGQTGGHVGFVGSKGAIGNGKFQFFGANTTRESITSESGVIFRRPPKPQGPTTKTAPEPQTQPSAAGIRGLPGTPSGPTASKPSQAPARAPTRVPSREGIRPATGSQLKRGQVNSSDLYNTLKKRFTGSPLDGYVPKDGARWGITKGTPDEWARLGTGVAKQESGLNSNSSGGGLYQMESNDLRRYGVSGDVNDPNAQVEGMARQWERSIPKDGVVSQPAPGNPGTGNSWLGAGRYFGSMRDQGWHGKSRADVDKYLGRGGWADQAQKAAQDKAAETAQVPPTASSPSTAPVTAPRGAEPPAMLAATGQAPVAFIVHHTGGRGTAESVKSTLDQRGLGVEYVMERDGTIHQIGKPGAANILPESRFRKNPILGDGKPFLTNQNIVGMEVIAKDDKDVTPAQIAAARKFISDRYPNTPVFGHGEVNPGHKEPDEGLTITKAIRDDRAKQQTAPSVQDQQSQPQAVPKDNKPPPKVVTKDNNPAPWPVHGTKAWDKDAPNPVQHHVKVDNRSDLDVSAAKTHSDNDSGKSKSVDNLVPADL